MSGFRDLAVLVVFAMISACGGGNSSIGGMTLPPPRANTPLGAYLPLGAGNVWIFTSGSQLRDVGSVTMSCSCALASIPVEQLDAYDAGQMYAGSLYYVKQIATSPPVPGHRLTSLVGVSLDRGALVQIATDSYTAAPLGLVQIDDTPAIGERFDDFGGQAISTIVSANGSQAYGNEQITGIAVDSMSSSALNASIGFAAGVGFTSVASPSAASSLSSFTVGPSSQSARRHLGTAMATNVSPGLAAFLTSANTVMVAVASGRSSLSR